MLQYITLPISAPNAPRFRKVIGTPCPDGAVAGTVTMAKGFGGGSNIHGHCPSENRHNDRRAAPLRGRKEGRQEGRKSPLLIVLFSPRPLCPNDLQRRGCSCCRPPPSFLPPHPADRRPIQRDTLYLPARLRGSRGCVRARNLIPPRDPFSAET